MMFSKEIQGAKEAIKFGRETRKELPITYADFFVNKSTVLDYLGMTKKQRIGCMAGCGVVGMFFMLHALMNILSIPTKPERFGKSYAIFTLMCVLILCLFSGFKTVGQNMASIEMLPYSTMYIANTAVILICTNWMYIVKLLATIFEVAVFFMLMYAYMTRKFSMSMIKGLVPFSLFR